MLVTNLKNSIWKNNLTSINNYNSSWDGKFSFLLNRIKIGNSSYEVWNFQKGVGKFKFGKQGK